MSNNEKKQYKCALPTNGYVEGQLALLTDAEIANFNGGEKQPRFVPVEEASQSTAMSDENKKAEGEICTLEDGTEGVINAEGVCVAKAAEVAQPKEGDPCTLDDGTEGSLKADADGNLACSPKAEGEEAGQ